jgi:hypothetical protein
MARVRARGRRAAGASRRKREEEEEGEGSLGFSLSLLPKERRARVMDESIKGGSRRAGRRGTWSLLGLARGAG